MNIANQILAGTAIKGDIISDGDIRIDGSLTGNLTTKGKVVIGESGSIKGEINCKNSVVEGKVDGKFFVAELLSLKSTSQITGDIKTSRLAIEPGAKFTGNCNMSNNPAVNAQVTTKSKEDEGKS
ncbi:MAG: polymer-forming cytoskeletal protein [Bacteroidales bacterium]|nr:polymer-forming cytoskeletal protein [Bacteroidales bacterium]